MTTTKRARARPARRPSHPDRLRERSRAIVYRPRASWPESGRWTARSWVNPNAVSDRQHHQDLPEGPGRALDHQRRHRSARAGNPPRTRRPADRRQPAARPDHDQLLGGHRIRPGARRTATAGPDPAPGPEHGSLDQRPRRSRSPRWCAYRTSTTSPTARTRRCWPQRPSSTSRTCPTSRSAARRCIGRAGVGREHRPPTAVAHPDRATPAEHLADPGHLVVAHLRENIAGAALRRPTPSPSWTRSSRTPTDGKVR